MGFFVFCFTQCEAAVFALTRLWFVVKFQIKRENNHNCSVAFNSLDYKNKNKKVISI